MIKHAFLIACFVFYCRGDDEESVAEGEPLPYPDARSLLRELVANPLVGCTWVGVTCAEDNVTALMIEWPSYGLTGPLGNEFQALTGLTVFDFENNDLTGTIPSELGLLTDLEVIHLEQNSLTGTIPPEVGRLSRIVRYDFEKNQLTGTIPPFWVRDLPVLERLYLDNNNLQGTIPSELGLSSSLRRIRVNGNELTGTIPSEIGSIPSLQRFYVNHNFLEGTIPAELGPNPVLSDMQLYQNSFTGSVTADLEAKGICGENMYAMESDDASVCVQCPLLSRSWASSVSFEDCVCVTSVPGVKKHSLGCGCSNDLYLDRVTMTCEQCGRGLDCDWDGNHTLSLHAPKTKPGFWAAPVEDPLVFQGHVVYGCANSELCIGSVSDGKMTDCEGERLGMACALCPDGQVSSTTGPCTTCDKDASTFTLILCIIILVFIQMFVLQVLGMADKFSKTKTSTRTSLQAAGQGSSQVGKMKAGGGGAAGASQAGELRQLVVVAGSILKHFQTIGLLSTLSIELPDEVFNFISSFRFLTPEFNVALGFACLTGGEFEAALIWTWLIPWIMIAVCVFAFLVSKMVAPLSGGRMSSLDLFALFAVITATWITFYTAFTDQVLMYWRCESRDGVASTNAFFRAVECGTDDYNSWMPLAVIFTFVNSTLPFAPVLYVAVVIAKGTDENGKLSRAFSFFFVNFRQGSRWWPVVALCKDLCLLITVLIFTEPFLQATIMAFILSCYLVGALYIRPQMKTSMLRLEVTLITFSIAVMITVGGGFSSSILNDDETSMRTVVSMILLVPALVLPIVYVLIYILITIIPGSAKLKIRENGGASARNVLNIFGFRHIDYDVAQVAEAVTQVRKDSSPVEMLVDRMDEVERLSINSSLRMLGKLASAGQSLSTEQKEVVTV